MDDGRDGEESATTVGVSLRGLLRETCPMTSVDPWPRTPLSGKWLSRGGVVRPGHGYQRNWVGSLGPWLGDLSHRQDGTFASLLEAPPEGVANLADGRDAYHGSNRIGMLGWAC